MLPGEAGVIRFTLPIRLPSASNLREHWTHRHKRVKSQRGAVTMYLGGRPRPALPLTVTLTRIAPRKLDSHDNLTGAFKGPADAIAAWLGVPDNHPGLTWAYAQRSDGVRVYGVEIRIDALSPDGRP